MRRVHGGPGLLGPRRDGQRRRAAGCELTALSRYTGEEMDVLKFEKTGENYEKLVKIGEN